MGKKTTEELSGLIFQTSFIIQRKMKQGISKESFISLHQDLVPHHLMILSIVKETGFPSMTQICDKMIIAKPQLTRSVDKLIEMGLVERQFDAKDRRKILIVLTPQGANTLKELEKNLRIFMIKKLSALNDEEITEIYDSFSSIARIFEKIGHIPKEK
jgi:DNA-binding MarR family transcriptional regulator